PVGDDLIIFGRQTGLRRWNPRASDGASRFGPTAILGAPQGRGHERACWSADGHSLAVVDGANQEVVILEGDGASERCRLRPDPKSPPLASLALSTDGRWAAAAHFQEHPPFLPGIVTVWDATSGQSRTVPGSPPSNHIGFSPDGSWLVVGGVADY